jgi:propanediol dehydratase small subunit
MREAKMDEVAVRLECLRLAIGVAGDQGTDALATAREYAAWVLAGSDPATAPVPHPARDE